MVERRNKVRGFNGDATSKFGKPEDSTSQGFEGKLRHIDLSDTFGKKKNKNERVD